MLFAEDLAAVFAAVMAAAVVAVGPLAKALGDLSTFGWSVKSSFDRRRFEIEQLITSSIGAVAAITISATMALSVDAAICSVVVDAATAPVAADAAAAPVAAVDVLFRPADCVPAD